MGREWVSVGGGASVCGCVCVCACMRVRVVCACECVGGPGNALHYMYQFDAATHQSGDFPKTT